MKTVSRIAASAAILTALLASCTDLDSIIEEVDSLENRVTTLETVTTALNKNIEALQTIVSGATINSATEKDGVWTLVLSNGQTLTLTQGSVGVGAVPVMSVDKDGYWMVDYDGASGNAPEYVMKGNEKVMASGTDGKTPLFGVDADKYWTVSYDGGKTYEQVKGADGKPVSALPSGDVQDPYFADVKLTDGVFTVKLRSGEELTVPVIADFLCAIEATGVQTFNQGESIPYNVTLKSVKSTMITVPAGWSATLSEPVETKAVLTVTAPVLTKANIADSNSDISILAFSGQGLATIAKLQVNLSDVPVVVTPIASVTAGEATVSTLSYSVAVSNVTSWKYIHQKESEAAPDAAKIAAEGTAGTETTLTFSELEANTVYVLYVLPLNGETQGAVVNGQNTTLEPVSPVVTDLYQAYLDGAEIEIAGVKYSKTVNGEPKLLEATAADTDIRSMIHQKSGIFFLDAAEGASFKIGSIAEIKGTEMVLIGRHTDKETVFVPEMYFKFITGGLALKNLTIDMVKLDASGANNKYFINHSGTQDLDYLLIDDCKFNNIIKNVFTTATAACAYAVKTIRVINSDFELITGTTNLQIFNLYNSSVLDRFEEITFENNIVFNENTGGVCQVFNWGQSTTQTGTTWNLKYSFCNNTLYNAPSSNGHFKFYQVASIKMNKNILWASPSNNNASAMMIIYSTNQTGDNIDTSDNIAYGLADGKNWSIAHSNSKFIPATNTVPKLESDPLATVDLATNTFTPTAAYAEYGAQR